MKFLLGASLFCGSRQKLLLSAHRSGLWDSALLIVCSPACPNPHPSSGKHGVLVKALLGKDGKTLKGGWRCGEHPKLLDATPCCAGGTCCPSAPSSSCTWRAGDATGMQQNADLELSRERNHSQLISGSGTGNDPVEPDNGCKLF